MSASTVSETILVLASIILASGLAAYGTYMAGTLKSDISQTMSDVRRASDLRVEVVYASVNGSTFVIYAKNIGHLPITDYTLIDVYVGPYRSARLYTYESSSPPSTGHFTISDVDGDGLWEPQETAEITVCPASIPSASVYEVLVKPSGGTGSHYLFPSPP
ncbi:MAG: hypothetical protein H5T34_01670 [Candidatus Methanomethyliales bacterium]|nr:hypothetical protein [Candidatus Methanomethylicales archaeon]